MFGFHLLVLPLRLDVFFHGFVRFLTPFALHGSPWIVVLAYYFAITFGLPPVLTLFSFLRRSFDL